MAKVTKAKSKKPPVPSLEQEAKAFSTKKKPPLRPPKDLSRATIAAPILGGLLSGSGRGIRAKELVDEAYRYADMLIENQD